MNKSSAILIGVLIGVGIKFLLMNGGYSSYRNADFLCGFSYGGLATYIVMKG